MEPAFQVFLQKHTHPIQPARMQEDPGRTRPRSPVPPWDSRRDPRRLRRMTSGYFAHCGRTPQHQPLFLNNSGLAQLWPPGSWLVSKKK